MTQTEFLAQSTAVAGGGLGRAETAQLKAIYDELCRAVNTQWANIQSGEADLERLVRAAYRVPQEIYREVIDRTPPPAIEWAMRA
jgi:hypothetical protein